MIASRHDVKYALTTILGETPDEIVLDRWTHEVQRRNLSALHLDILTLSRGKFHAGSNGIQDAASSLLDWDEFVRRFVKAKEQYVTSLGSPPEAICQLGEDAWFHSFELSDGTSVRGAKTPGVLSAEFDAVFAPLSLEGQSVLDVGAWNGAFSFEAKRRGAARVMATDMYTWAHPFFRGFERFLYIRKDLELAVDYKLIDTTHVERYALGNYDVVLLLGVFYHLQDPVTAIINISEIVTGWLIIETYLDLDEVPHPAMRYYPGAELAGDPTNWWGPNRQFVEALLQTVGFEEIYFTPNPCHSSRGIFHARRTNGRVVGWRLIPSVTSVASEKTPSLAASAAASEVSWPRALGSLVGRNFHRFKPKSAWTTGQVATALYRGILQREPDASGFQDKVDLLRSGHALEHVIRILITSPEFRSRTIETLVPTTPLPDLRVAMPEMYEMQRADLSPILAYVARSDGDIARMRSLIDKHRYYDRFGVWAPVIDLDKVITAAIVRGLGARSCCELGCFTGPVLSLLAEAGIAVLGTEVSHTAFTFAYPNVRDSMLFGDLLALDIDRRFDVVLCMDVLEHISPLLLDAYIERIASLVDPDGYVYLNSPMWGRDRVFGLFEEQYLEEWRSVGDGSYWRHWPCDERGWPLHGHLVWASPRWWERKFGDYGLVRDTRIEQAIHSNLSGFFEQAVGRRCLFVLRQVGSCRASEAVAASVHTALAACPGLPLPSTSGAQS